MGLSFSNSSGATEAEHKWIDEKLKEQKVVIFSKTTCPFCNRAKKMLDNNQISYKSYELNRMDNCSQIQDALQGITGARTVRNDG